MTLKALVLAAAMLALAGCATDRTAFGDNAAPRRGAPASHAVEPSHRQYFDQRARRYYYFDSKAARYDWEDGTPKY